LRPGEDVIRVDYVDEARLWSLLSACEVCVNLRYPTMGETSGVVVRALSLGLPLVVSDVGWFAELPDEAVVKVPVGEGEVPAITDALELLARDQELRTRMAEAARSLAQGKHQLDLVAEAYVAALEEAAGGAVVQDAVLGEIARAAQETGLPANGNALSDIAERLREVGPGR
jgi:glycosyltransferase involved in cell wall biosynthesis